MNHTLDQALRELPQIAPPAGTWAKLAAQLDAETAPSATGYQRYNRPLGAAVAAALVLAVMIINPGTAPDGLMTSPPVGGTATAQSGEIYSADQALLEGLLETRIENVDAAIDYGSPEEQQLLRDYRNYLNTSLSEVQFEVASDQILY